MDDFRDGQWDLILKSFRVQTAGPQAASAWACLCNHGFRHVGLEGPDPCRQFSLLLTPRCAQLSLEARSDAAHQLSQFLLESCFLIDHAFSATAQTQLHNAPRVEPRLTITLSSPVDRLQTARGRGSVQGDPEPHDD